MGASGEAAAKVLRKGSLVTATGRLRREEWETTHGERSAVRLTGRAKVLAAP